MKIFPTIYQWFVAQTLSHIRAMFPKVYCYHYRDDILIAPDMLADVECKMRKSFQQHGFFVAPEKVQKLQPGYIYA